MPGGMPPQTGHQALLRAILQVSHPVYLVLNEDGSSGAARGGTVTLSPEKPAGGAYPLAAS